MTSDYSKYPQTLEECWAEINELEALVEKYVEQAEKAQDELADARAELMEARALASDASYRLGAAENWAFDRDR